VRGPTFDGTTGMFCPITRRFPSLIIVTEYVCRRPMPALSRAVMGGMIEPSLGGTLPRNESGSLRSRTGPAIWFWKRNSNRTSSAVPSRSLSTLNL
jgi:hypothetical protein